MKISCTPVSAANEFTGKVLDQAKYFELIAAAGAEATDLVDPSSYGWFWQDIEKDKAALPGLLKANGLAVSAYATSNNFTVAEPEQIASQIAKVTNAIHEAAELEISTLRIFGGYHKSIGPGHTKDYADGLMQVTKCIEKILPEAEKCGVVLALENHGRIPGLPEELLYIMKYFDSKYLGICFDIANFTAFYMNEKVDAVEAYKMVKQYIRHVHCKDWATAPAGSPHENVACACGKGNGIVPLRRLAYMMQEDRFPGYWALEYEGPVTEGITESLQYMKSIKDAAELLYPEK